jgi:hypothetical protein
LEFNNIRNGSGTQLISFAVPTTGPDAIVVNGWYHVAAVYNGAENTPNNITLYWTAMDSSRTSASPLGSAQMTFDLVATGSTFIGIGNSAKLPAASNFLGYTDEVRISKIARAADGMMFAPAPPAIVTQPASQTVGVG